MRKMLVLGSDYYTLQVVLEAKKLGVYVIVADLMDTSPTKEAANESWLVSTADIDLLEKKCIENEISAIMFGASDFNVGKARTLCKRLKLPIYCDSEDAWIASRDKAIFKEVCKKNGAPVAKDYYLSAEPTRKELDQIEYPVVVKPVDLSGNRGITFCFDEKQLLDGYKYAQSVTKNSKIIIEKKLAGTTYNINYVVGSGTIRLASFAESTHAKDQPSYVYSFSRNANRFLKQYLREVNDSVIRTFESLNCKEGIVWIDAIRDEAEGKFYVLEMGYRFPAALASSPFYEHVTGFNPVKWMIECALGEKHDEDNMPAPLTGGNIPIVAIASMFAKKGGNITRIDGLDKLKECSNVFVDMPKQHGGTVRDMATVALITMWAHNGRELADTLRMINDNFAVYNENGENILIYYTDYQNIIDTYYEGLKEYGITPGDAK